MIALLESAPAVLEMLVDDAPAGRTREDDADNREWTAARFLDALRRYGSVRVLQEVRCRVPFDGAAQYRTVRFAARHGQRVRRLALVGDGFALRRRVSILEGLIGGEVRCFAPSDRETARRWLVAA